MNRNYLRLFLVILFIGVTFYISSRFTIDKEYYLEMLEEKKQEHYSGRIVAKYKETPRKHPLSMLKLSDSTEVQLRRVFWEQVSPGDSIVKIKGRDYITLYKTDGSQATYSDAEFIQG